MNRVETSVSSAKKPLTTFRFAMLLGAVIAFGPPLSIDTYLPALPAMGEDLHTTETLLQFTLTAFIIGISLGQLVIGPITDAVGRRKPLLFGLTTYVVATFLCAMSTSVGMLIGMRVVQALGAAACLVAVKALTRDLFSGTRLTKFFSMMVLVTGSAPVIAPIIGGQILRWSSWRGIFVMLGLLGALVLIVVILILPETHPTQFRHPARFKAAIRIYRGLLTEKVFLGYLLVTGLVASQVFAYLSGSSFALQGDYQLSPQQYSLVFGLNAIATLAGSQVNSRLVDHFSEVVLLRYGLSVAVLCGVATLVASLWSLPLLFLLIPLWIQIFCCGLALPNLSSLGLSKYPKIAGSAGGLLGVIPFAMGGMVGPLLSLGESNSANPMTIALAGLSILALLTFFLLIKGKTRLIKGKTREYQETVVPPEGFAQA